MALSQEWYVADFETTGEKFYRQYGYTKVWLYAISNSDGVPIVHGDSIEDFFKYVRKNLMGKLIYFHNLKFDGSFIMDWLFTNGFRTDYGKDPAPKTFKTLIGDMGEFYSIDVQWDKYRKMHFADSLKLLPFKVSYIAKSFNLPILKEKIDYDDYTIDADRIRYVEHDVSIVALALREIKRHGMNKMTTASCAFDAYTSMQNPNMLSYCFPELPDDFLIEWRKAYRGGRCQVNPMHEGKVLKGVNRYDVNSMYPHVMRNMPMPYGAPMECKTENELRRFKFGILHIRCEFVLKEGHMPTLLKKGGLYSAGDSYYITSDGIEDLRLTTVDWLLMKRHYEILTFEYLEGYGFYTSKGMFRGYVDKWYSKKKVDEYGKKQVDKFMLNCLYGKYGTDFRKRQKIAYYDGCVRFKYGEYENGRKFYLPVALAVTSWAHLLIDDAIEGTGYSNFVYCDTDSVHTLGRLPDSMVDQKELGRFKLEGVEARSKYVRQKCYLYEQGGKISITCAGMSPEMKEWSVSEYGDSLFDCFGIGYKCKGKKMPIRVKGGTILHETTFEIK